MTAVRFLHAGFCAGGANMLAGLDFELRAGEWTCLLGPPGCGKSKLLRLAAGALAPTSGAIERAGRSTLAGYDTPLDDTKSARDIVADAMAGRADAQARAIELLGALGLETYLNHEPFRLSRGHRVRLAIAQAIAARPALLCLDDPFSPLDQAARRRAGNVLGRAIDEDGLAVLMVANDPLDALRSANRIILMTQGPGARVAEILDNAPRPAAPDETLQAMRSWSRLLRVLGGES